MVELVETKHIFEKKLCNHAQCNSYIKAIDELVVVKKISKKLDTILESSYDGIFLTDGYGVATMVNKAYERITGIMAEDVIGKNVSYLVENGFISQSCSLMVIKTREITTIQQELSSGKVVLVTGTPILDYDGTVEMVVINVRDVTEFIRLKEALQEKDEKMLSVNRELEMLKEQLGRKGEFFSRNPIMIKLLQCARRVAAYDTTVLIKGETGVGKEVLVDYIHSYSGRSDKKLVKVNCGAIPENLIESELFGYEKGAFTGANKEGKVGLFEEANGGTIFLDEIGELPYKMQAKLLRVLQEQEVQRIGSTETKKINVRIIAATNKNLKEMSENDTFRSDLYYRLSIVPLEILALRDRPCDIIPLCNTFLKSLNEKNGTNKIFTKAVYDQFYRYPWPGNIRELKNMIERIFVMAGSDIVDVDSLPDEFSSECKDQPSDIIIGMKESVMKYEYQLIEDAMIEKGSIRGAAKLLQMDASTLLRKKRKIEKTLGISSS